MSTLRVLSPAHPSSSAPPSEAARVAWETLQPVLETTPGGAVLDVGPALRKTWPHILHDVAQDAAEQAATMMRNAGWDASATDTTITVARRDPDATYKATRRRLVALAITAGLGIATWTQWDHIVASLAPTTSNVDAANATAMQTSVLGGVSILLPLVLALVLAGTSLLAIVGSIVRRS